MINLQSFCGDDADPSYLHKPFSYEDFTYATDERIMVRVPRRENVPELSADNPIKDPTKPMQGFGTVRFAPPPPYSIPTGSDEVKCPSCEGRGLEHDCPDCTCICAKCEGTGALKTSTTVGSINFDLNYLRQVLALPGVEIAEPQDRAPLYFRFTGGDGALMPLTRQYPKHVEIFGKIAQAYQVIAALLVEAGEDGTAAGQRALDYFSQDRFDPDFLPWAIEEGK